MFQIVERMWNMIVVYVFLFGLLFGLYNIKYIYLIY